jgi:P27 family predicted phage terminase small subunit
MAETIPVRRTRDREETRHSLRALPSPPSHLSARGKRIWREIVAAWVVGPEALPILRAGLESLDLYDMARAQLATEGLTIRHPESGAMRAHPAAAVMKDALSGFRQCFRQLGLQPPVEL